MNSFLFSYKYMDDLCVLNNENMLRFLQPDSRRTPNNAFWIYPLNVVEIKLELDKVHQDNSGRGITGHFLNVQLQVLDVQTSDFHSSKFDKRRNLLFKFQQYILLKSNRPIKQSYSIVVSQVVPILYMANTMSFCYR